MKRDRKKGSRSTYWMAAVLAAFCVLGNGTVALGAPVSDEEQLTAGVGQILDSLPVLPHHTLRARSDEKGDGIQRRCDDV